MLIYANMSSIIILQYPLVILFKYFLLSSNMNILKLSFKKINYDFGVNIFIMNIKNPQISIQTLDLI